MAFLKIGTVEVDVQTAGASRLERHRLGDKERASDGTMRSTVRGYKDAWRCTTGPMSQTDAAALETAIGLGAVNVEGDFVWASSAFAAIVTVTAMEPVPDIDDASGAQWVMALLIEEV